MATTVLLRLAAWTGEARYREAAERAIGTVQPYLARYPTGLRPVARGGDASPRPTVDEVAVVGSLDDAATRDAARARSGRPGGRTRSWRSLRRGRCAASAVPLLHDRVAIDGRPTAYVCRHFACRLPVTEPSALADQLGA